MHAQKGAANSDEAKLQTESGNITNHLIGVKNVDSSF